MKTFFFDTHNDRQFNRAAWIILIICAALAIMFLALGLFPQYKWNVFIAYLVMLPGLIIREWYNYGHNGFAFAITALWFVGGTLYVIFAWTSFLN
ncbi:hypothetical protein [Solitalea lacus]|uniref:hypothetical protein n=1 Tax=Solitalea lacus TaxID=2911172 RepID=UPI001EDC8471|nr:hypothetical protein [Solitalea lacus]UKJ07613.1 hypothetical protein L2B55_00265 [Solitalea lacus]